MSVLLQNITDLPSLHLTDVTSVQSEWW